MPTKDDKQLAEDTWLLRNPGKPLPNTNAAKAAYQRLRAREQKSADEKRTKREARLALKKRAALQNITEPQPGGENEDEAEEDNREEENPEFIDGAPVVYGWTVRDRKEDELVDDDNQNEEEDIEDGLDQWGYAFFIDKHHPIPRKRDEATDASPMARIQLRKSSINDSSHMLEQSEMKSSWTEEDYDPTLWGDRGTGNAQIVGYRRRSAARDERTNSISILRVVQNKKLVTFMLKSYYECARCIPYTQLTITDKADGCFEVPEKQTHWLMDEKFDNVSKEIRRERKRLHMVDLGELFYWGKFGMKWAAGGKKLKLQGPGCKKISIEGTDESSYVFVGGTGEEADKIGKILAELEMGKEREKETEKTNTEAMGIVYADVHKENEQFEITDDVHVDGEAETECVRIETAEEERVRKEEAEAERVRKEEEAEAERVSKEEAEAERVRKEEEAEAERVRKEKEEAEVERVRREEAEAERVRNEEAEAERVRKEEADAEVERVRREEAEAERVRKEEAEAERVRKEEAEAEGDRVTRGNLKGNVS